MAVKIRLSRHGKKNFAFYHIVVADSRSPRDGRFIEKIGSYNPNSNPATIELDSDKALSWLQKGAQPSPTCRAILSYKGILLKKHLMTGVKKGAITEDVANQRFNAWLKEQEAKVQAKKDKLVQAKDATAKSRLENETKVNAAKAEALAKKRAEALAKAEEAKKAAEAKAAEATEQAADATATEAEKPAAEEPKA